MKKYPVTWNHSLDEIYSGVTPTVPSLYSTVLHDLNVFKSSVKNKKKHPPQHSAADSMGKNNTWVADHWWNHVAKPQTAEPVYMSASSQPLGGDSIQGRGKKLLVNYTQVIQVVLHSCQTQTNSRQQ